MNESRGIPDVTKEYQRILFVNHSRSQCGVYEFGKNVYSIICHSTKFDFRYAECSGITDLQNEIRTHRPAPYGQNQQHYRRQDPKQRVLLAQPSPPHEFEHGEEQEERGDGRGDANAEWSWSH